MRVETFHGTSLHTVTVVEPDHGLGEGLVVEDGLYPQDALFVPEVLGEVEGGDDRHRLLGAVEPDGVFVGLHEHLAVLVGDQDARASLLVRGVLAALELGVDDEGGLALFRGPDLIEYPEGATDELSLEEITGGPASPRGREPCTQRRRRRRYPCPTPPFGEAGPPVISSSESSSVAPSASVAREETTLAMALTPSPARRFITLTPLAARP